MSNLNPEIEYQDHPTALNFIIDQKLKDINTSLPAIIDSFDPSTKRAIVQIAINKTKTDGSSLPYPLLYDVPILFPATSQYQIFLPLTKGDSILLIFSQRGINNFKQTYSQSDPDVISFLSIKDAIGIIGFGQLTQDIVDIDALVLQTTDQATYISLKDGQITINATNVIINGTVTINDDLNVNQSITTDSISSQSIVTQSITVNGSDYSQHAHGGVQTGTSQTTPPIN